MSGNDKQIRIMNLDLEILGEPNFHCALSRNRPDPASDYTIRLYEHNNDQARRPGNHSFHR
jgi:hypothetical protein